MMPIHNQMRSLLIGTSLLALAACSTAEVGAERQHLSVYFF